MIAATELDGVLGDVVFLAITVAFVGLAWLVVNMCDHISSASDAAAHSAPDDADVADVVDAEVREPAGAPQ